MNGLTALMRFGDIEDKYVEAAFLPSETAVDAAAEKPRRRSGFLNSGWVAAAVCVVVGIGVYVTLLGLGKGWFGRQPAGTAEGTGTEITEPAETDLVIKPPAEGVYIARTDQLRKKRQITRSGAIPLLGILERLTFEPGQPDIRPDLVLMVDGSYYLCRSATGQINDPEGGLTAVMTEEDRLAFIEFYESGYVRTGFPDELIQIEDADQMEGLKRYILENGGPCTVYRSGSSHTLFTYEPHCLEYRGHSSLIVMTVDSQTGCVVVYFSYHATMIFRENGDMYFKMHEAGGMNFEHITPRGQPYDHNVTNVFHQGSGGPKYLPWEDELYYCQQLDKAFRRGWGLNVTLQSLGYMIDESMYTDRLY